MKYKGKRLIVAKGDIVEEETGKLVATGLGTFTQYPADRRENLRTVAGMGDIDKI